MIGHEKPQKVRIGDAEQWLLLCGDPGAGRALLFLHGGPGLPVFPLADEIRAAAPELERAYVLAFWEQRGTGKSYAAGLAPGVMTIDRFVADAIELMERLALRLGLARVHLMGHSWGSVVGALAAHRRPDLTAAYIGAGQVTDFPESEARSYRWALDEARSRGDGRAVSELLRIGPPPHGPRQVMIERKWLMHLGGHRRKRAERAARAYWRIARHRAYGWNDIARMIRDPTYSLSALWPQLQSVNLFHQVPKLSVPVFLLAGRHDGVVPSSLVSDWFDWLDAPAGKHLVWFDNAAHLPFLEEPAKFEQLLCGAVAAHGSGG